MNLAQSIPATRVRRSGIAIRTVLAIASFALAPQLARAQPIRIFALDSLTGYLESAAFTDRIQRDWISSRPHLEDNEDGLSEALQLGLGGSIYHPRLIGWNATGKLTFKQRFLSTQARGSDRDIYDKLREFSAATSILRDHPVTASLFAARTTSDVDGDFQEAINVNRNSVGGAISYSGSRLVQRAVVQRSRYVAEGLIKNDEIRRSARYDATLKLSRLYGNARYEYNHDEFLTYGRTTRGHIARLYGSLPVDRSGRSSISSSIVFNHQTSQFLNRYLEGSLSARAALGGGFDGSASVSHRDNRTDTVSSHVNAANAALVHHLYQSLTTRVAGEATFGTFETGEQRDLSPSANVDYRKRTFFGSLHLFSGLSYRRYSDDFVGSTPTLREREFTYVPGVLLLIEDFNADTASILIVNRSRPDQTPQPGIDYYVVPFGDVFEISVLSTGSIQEGDELLVQYLLQSRGSFEFEEVENSYGAGVIVGTFGTFGIEHQTTDRNLLSGVPTASVSDIAVDNIHASLQHSGLRVEGQYQLRRTSINPYKRRAVILQFMRPLLSNLNFVIKSSYAVTDFPDVGERSYTYDIAGSLWYRPGRHLTLESRSNAVKRTGRRDDGYELFWANRALYTIQRIQLELRVDIHDRKIDVVGTENRVAARFTIRRSL